MSETAYVAKENMLWFQSPSPDPNYFQNLVQNLMGTSLFKDTSVKKIGSKSDHFLRRYKPNCGKNAISRTVEESFKKFLYPDPEADD